MSTKARAPATLSEGGASAASFASMSMRGCRSTMGKMRCTADLAFPMSPKPMAAWAMPIAVVGKGGETYQRLAVPV